MGDFVPTGSAQFDLNAGITQTLAGRVGRVELLPLSAAELVAAHQAPPDLHAALFQGAYPALYERDVSPQDWFANYIATYLERDVRQLLTVRDLGQFQTFVKMCAARTGQLLNLTSLGAAVRAQHRIGKANHWLKRPKTQARPRGCRKSTAKDSSALVPATPIGRFHRWTNFGI